MNLKNSDQVPIIASIDRVKKLSKMLRIAYEVKDVNLLAVRPYKDWYTIHKVDSLKGGKDVLVIKIL